MLNCVEGFGKVKFQEYNFSLRSLALMYVLERPRQTIMDGSPTKVSVLVVMNYLQDDFLQTICQNLGDHFKAAVEQCDRAKVIDCHMSIRLRYQSDMSIIDALQIQISYMELFT